MVEIIKGIVFKMELISIIVPVYNIEQYIAECLETVRKQTYTDIEVIVVDDGSTDNSGSICDKIAELDNRISVFHKKHEGLSAARNFGIDKSKGEYLVFIDGDDQVEFSLIKHLHSLVKDENAQMGICELTHSYDDSEIIYKNEKRRRVFNSSEAITEILYQKSFLVSACAKIYPKEFFRDVRFPEGLIFEDAAVMCRILEKAERIAYSDARLYAYIHREGTITTKIFSDKDFDILAISKSIVGHYRTAETCIRKAAYIYFVNSCMRIYLNAPRKERYHKKIAYCENHIKKGGWKCLINPNVRNKLKVALILFSLNRNLLFVVYKRIDRWS